MKNSAANVVRAWTVPYRWAYVFSSLILALLLLPAFQHSDRGKLWFGGATVLVLMSAVGAIGRQRLSLRVAVLLAGPALVLLVMAQLTDGTGYLVWSWVFGIALVATALARLLLDLLRQGRIGVNELYGGAAGYLLVGFLWCYLYAVVEYLAPGSFSGLGPIRLLHVADTVYFSFNVLTTVGFTDITAQGRAAHSLVILEELAGTLFLVIIIARLVSQYQAPRPMA